MSFILFVTLIFLNLFIAIILQSFADINEKENLFLNDTNVGKFATKWAKYDPEGTGFIGVNDLALLFFKIGPPLGFEAGKFRTRRLQNEFISELKLPTYKNFKFFYFYDVLTALARVRLIKESIAQDIYEKKKDDEVGEVDMTEVRDIS